MFIGLSAPLMAAGGLDDSTCSRHSDRSGAPRRFNLVFQERLRYGPNVQIFSIIWDYLVSSEMLAVNPPVGPESCASLHYRHSCTLGTSLLKRRPCTTSTNWRMRCP